MVRYTELPHELMLHYVLYCLNLKSGKVEWQKEFYTGRPPGGRHRKNSFTSESPITDGKFVYVYVANLGLWAFDTKGKQAWTTPLEANPIYLDFGTGSSPALAGNLLVIVNDNEKQQYIAAFDKQSGKQVWRTNRDLGGPPERAQRHSFGATPSARRSLRLGQDRSLVTTYLGKNCGGCRECRHCPFQLHSLTKGCFT